jgi:hypothetical protein
MIDSTKTQEWKKLKRELIGKRFPLHKKPETKLGFYDLVFVATNLDGTPMLYQSSKNDIASYLAFTQPELVDRMNKPQSEFALQGLTSVDLPKNMKMNTFHLRPFMLGDLITTHNDNENYQAIKINPLTMTTPEGDITMAEEVIFIPLFDQVTKKFMMTHPDEALALLAIRPEDQERLGMEIVFYSITNRSLSDDKELRETQLRDKIEELAFLAPRIPVKRGSASFICVLLNLENAMEEVAFIRNYQTFDSYTDIVFVTSALEILTGELESIQYDGEQIDTIFMPLVDWQKNQWFKKGVQASKINSNFSKETWS